MGHKLLWFSGFGWSNAGMSKRAAIGFLLAAIVLPVRADVPLRLSLPVGCTIGPGCLVQNYVDQDPSPGAHDFACSGLTYDGHKGTDIRLRDVAAMTAGVDVLAAAEGTVKGVRDGMADISIRDPAAPDIKGRECGNGVVIEHGDGWVTQYCHLRRGSVGVKAGDKVARGAPLGFVGLSGDTEFAHLHFEVRHGATVIDPFTGSAAGTSACGASLPGLWDGSVAAALAHRPPSFLMGGFADRGLDLRSLEQAAPDTPGGKAVALVAYVRVLGVSAGDVETLSVSAPDGTAFAKKGPVQIPGAKAQWLSFVGRKRTQSAWPAGTYRAHYTLERAGAALVDQTFEVTVR